MESSLILLPNNITNSESLIIQHAIDGRLLECINEAVKKYEFLKLVHDIPSFLSQLDEIKQKLHNEEIRFELFLFSLSCLQSFIQQNWTGPFVKPSITNTVWGEVVREKDVFIHLEIDGEFINENVRDIFLLAISLKIFHKIDEILNIPLITWWKLRSIWIYQQVLSEISHELKVKCEQSIKDIIGHPDTEKIIDSLKVQLNIEVGLIFLFYYQYDRANEYFINATRLSGIQCTMTGKMGVRTRFQQKPTAQLCFKVKQLHKVETLIKTNSNVPKPVLLNNDTLLESVKYVDSEENIPDLCPEQQAVLLAFSTHMTKTKPSQVLDKEEVKTILQVNLAQPKCWAIQSETLKCRCVVEDDRPKTVERSMMQVEELVKLVRTWKEANSGMETCRLDLFHCIQMDPIWNLEKRLARLYTSLGANKSALEIYLRLKMWDEAIIALMVTGRGEEAKNLIKQQLSIKETPTLWCLLGDVLLDKTYYEKAWEISNHRSTRAMRCLGAFHVSKKNFSEAVRCFEESLKVNEYQTDTSFSLGCAYMVLQNYKGAVHAFLRCTSLNWDNFEAWANLSTCYIRCGEKDKAFKTLQDAIRCNFNQWQIWDNFLGVCIDTGHFNDAVNAYNKVLAMNDKFLDLKSLTILGSVVVEKIPNFDGKVHVELTTKVMELFGKVTSKTPNNWKLWVLYAYLIGNGVDEDQDNTTNSKALIYLQKALKYATHAGWEKDSKNIRQLYEIGINLKQAMVHALKHSTMNTETLRPMVATVRLQINGLISTLKKYEEGLLNQSVKNEISNLIDQINTNIKLPINELFNSIITVHDMQI